MDKKSYIEQAVLRLLRSWASFALIAGSFVIISLSVLDYFVTPENFHRFLIYRLITAFLFIIIYLLNRLRESKYFQIGIYFSGTAIVSAMVELMILSFGGHQSIYYVGMIIVFMFCLGFLPLFNIKNSIIMAIMIYAIYLVPILLFDNINNIRVFINNNIFLLTTALIGIIWRYYNDTLFLKKLSLEYDLSEKKEQLEKYSTRLEQLVAERTRELKISEQKFRGLFDNANDGVAVLDKNGIILNVNQKFCELHGFEKETLLGTPIRLIEAGDHKEKEERMNRILNGEPLIFETEHYRKDGSRISLEVSSKAIEIGGELYVQSLHRDVTEKKRLQEQLFQSQKMESIGMLAGGIAHDFNNVLTSILGHVELLHEFGDLDAPVKQKIKIIEDSTRKAGRMVSRILSFVRKRDYEVMPINLNDVIRDTLELTRGIMAKRNVEIKAEIDGSTSPVICSDANQMEQVIMNLLVNAADAMPDGGTITIKTSIAELKNEASHIHPLLRPGKYVVLEVSDTGTGIPDEIRTKVFDPFFTTKEPGKGTGLGLSMVYGIVKDHNGVIDLKTEVGKGTTFNIYLPASERIVPRIEKPPFCTMAGRERILVVEDEPDLLSFIRDVLESQGYKVLAADNPVYAQDIFREIAADIDLVITDIVMPLLNGRELIRYFKTIKPSVKIIAISGYDIWNIGKKNKEIDAFIRKPFEGIYLLSVVRKVLDIEGSTTTLSMPRPM